MRVDGDGVGEGLEDGTRIDVEVGDVSRGADDFLDLVGAAILADEDGAIFEAGASLGGGFLIVGEGGTPGGAAPFPDTVVVIVGDKGGPERGDFVVVEADVIHGDGTPGEAAEDDLIGVDAVVGDDLRDGLFGVGDGGLFASPPGRLIAFLIGADEREVEPNGVASGETKAEGGVFDTTGGAKVGCVVAGEFHDEGVLFFAGFPVGGKVEGVVDLGSLIGKGGDEDAFPGRGFFTGDGGEGDFFLIDGGIGVREIGEGKKKEEGPSHVG